MKSLIVLTLLLSSTVFAKCPQAEWGRAQGWRLYPEDMDREIWHCKMTKADGYKQLEFCTGRVVSKMPVGEYVGLAGIEQWNREFYPDRVLPMTSMWIGLDHDKEGEVTDTAKEMLLVHTPTSDIMQNEQYKYTVKLNKRTGAGSYLVEKKAKPCIFCGGWKTHASAELKCAPASL